MIRSDVTFLSGAEICAGWLYEPPGVKLEAGPIIVMAHGLGGVKEMRLDAFAERFTESGYRCLVFDYRHFGASGGAPRQLLSIAEQQADWRAAVDYARCLDGADPERVVIWGTSFGGGHVIHTAARDHRLAAVIAQCPFTDGLASSLAIPPVTSTKVIARAVLDRLGTLCGRGPILVPSYGRPGSTALMTSADSAPGVEAIIPQGQGIRSDVAARFALDIIRYFPGRDARKITCPAHFAVCENDAVAPSPATLRHVARTPYGEIHLQRGGHFDIYVGDDFESNIAQQLDFLHHYVPVNA